MTVAYRIEPPTAEVKNQIIEWANEIANYLQIPNVIALGIISAESKFDPQSYRWNYDNINDRSFGLMHLTVPTARDVSRRYGWGSVDIPDLLDPTTNLRLGLVYFWELMNKYHTNIWDAVSAYNAGRPIKNFRGQYRNYAYLVNVYNEGTAYV